MKPELHITCIYKEEIRDIYRKTNIPEPLKEDFLLFLESVEAEFAISYYLKGSI